VLYKKLPWFIYVAASSTVPNNVVDKNSIERRVDELQEIEDSLVKLMAYRVCSSFTI
jgi:hypothetical protein